MLTWDKGSLPQYLVTTSARPLPDHRPPYTGAYYVIENTGCPSGSASKTPVFVLTYMFEGAHGDLDELPLGDCWPDLDTAKAAAERHEQTGDQYAGEPEAWFRHANLDARFLPQDARDETTRPCLLVGGVQVYAYFDEQTRQLVVSTHYDGAEGSAISGDGRVPTRVSIGGKVVFEG